MKLIVKMKNLPWIGEKCKNYIFRHYGQICDVIINLIDGHEVSIKHLKQLIKRQDLIDEIESESVSERKLAREFLKDKVEELYPEVLKSI